MSEEVPTIQPERKEGIDDNARKFTLTAIDADFLKQQSAISYGLIVDWLVTGANEKKIVYKKLESGEIQYFLIEKVSEGMKRKTNKNLITEEEYKKYLGTSILRVEKKRFEFNFIQKDISFKVKYDEFTNSKLRMLEVDANNEIERNAFKPSDFPYRLMEVTGDVRYYGNHVQEIV